MAETATVRVLFLGDAGGALRSTNLLSRSFSGLGRTAKLAGVAITAGIVTSMASATSAAIDFDRSMRNVNSIAKLSEGELAKLSKEVLGLAKVSGQAPKVLADGLYDIVSSGFQANDAIKVLRAGAKAATAGLTDTATATKAISAALNAYHLGAGRATEVSDILFQTVNKGVLTFEELAQNMGDLVPAAAPLGVSLEEVGAAIATITLQGVPAAEAATRVKNTFLQLASPSEELAGLLKKAGYESGEAAIQAEGFVGVLELLNKQTKGSVTETSKLTPEIRALMGVVGLTGKNFKTYKDNLAAMEGATEGAGATAEAFAEQGESISVQWDKAKANLTAAGIALAQQWFPAIETAIDLASDFAGWLEKLGRRKTIDAKVNFTVASARGLAGSIGDALFGTPGRRVRVPIEGNRFEWQIVGANRGIVDRLFGALESTFSSEAMLGKQGKRIRVPVEGGRFEWKIIGAKEGWLNALERELEGGIEEIDFSRVGKVLATTGSGLLQVAGVLAVALAKLIGKAIRDINWGEVGQEIAIGMRKAVGQGLEGIDQEIEKTFDDKFGTSPLIDLSGRDIFGGIDAGPSLTDILGLNEAVDTSVLDLLGIEAEEAGAAVRDLSGRVNVLGSVYDRLPRRIMTVLENNALMAKSKVEDYRTALFSIPSQRFTRLTLIEERRAQVLSGATGGSNALGTNFWRGGMSWVGERGPELVNLPRGSQVIPNHRLGTVGNEPAVIINAPPNVEALLRALIGEVVVRNEPAISRAQGLRADRRRRTLAVR